MSAARVLNPVVLSEFCKMRASPVSMANRNSPCGRQLNRIKRDLFGGANPMETNKLFTEQLEQHQEKATKKWGFDFRNGTPLTASPQFSWERVSFQESSYAPEMYTLTRAAHVRPTEAAPTALDVLLDERSERENHNALNFDDTDSCDDSHDDSASELTSATTTTTTAATTSGIFKVPAGRSRSEVSANSNNSPLSIKQLLRKRQPKITEYMKERKRLAQMPKKASPSKRLRSNSGSGSGVSHSTHANSISAHFSQRSQSSQRNN